MRENEKRRERKWEKGRKNGEKKEKKRRLVTDRKPNWNKCTAGNITLIEIAG
jgi:hypothetical protein